MPFGEVAGLLAPRGFCWRRSIRGLSVGQKCPPSLHERQRASPNQPLRELVETLHNRTVDGESRAPKLGAARAREQPILHEVENLEFFAYLAPKALVDSALGPLKKLRIPAWAIVQSNGWNSAQHVVGPESIGHIRR